MELLFQPMVIERSQDLLLLRDDGLLRMKHPENVASISHHLEHASVRE